MRNAQVEIDFEFVNESTTFPAGTGTGAGDGSNGDDAIGGWLSLPAVREPIGDVNVEEMDEIRHQRSHDQVEPNRHTKLLNNIIDTVSVSVVLQLPASLCA